jgi:hypothetical protein
LDGEATARFNQKPGPARSPARLRKAVERDEPDAAEHVAPARHEHVLGDEAPGHVRAEPDAGDQLQRGHDDVVEAAERVDRPGDPRDHDPRHDALLPFDEPRHCRDERAREHRAEERREPTVCVQGFRDVPDRRARAVRQHAVGADEDCDHAAADDVEDRRHRPQLGQLPPGVPLLAVEAGERHEEILGEELAAPGDEEDEADAEAERPEDMCGVESPPVLELGLEQCEHDGAREDVEAGCERGRDKLERRPLEAACSFEPGALVDLLGLRCPHRRSVRRTAARTQ